MNPGVSAESEQIAKTQRLLGFVRRSRGSLPAIAPKKLAGKCRPWGGWIRPGPIRSLLVVALSSGRFGRS
jgi:hypothetical protein